MEKTYSFPGGRLGNFLYYALYCHIQMRKNPDTACRALCYDANIYDYLSVLNLRSLATRADNPLAEYVNSYFQQYGKDYSRQDLDDFIRKYILSGTRYWTLAREHADLVDDSQSAMIHIRNGDYISGWKIRDKYAFFDRTRYISNTFGPLPDTVSSLFVFSDDLDIVRDQYSKLFLARFTKVVYMPTLYTPDDLLRMSLFKNKILFNSTYSCWSGYIGDASFITGHSVIAPTRVMSDNANYLIYNPEWTLINV